ncbi:cytochrome c [bacterium]|jgi:nitric oxide reductase subunit C|nr:cytochrome c [bacterium]
MNHISSENTLDDFTYWKLGIFASICFCFLVQGFLAYSDFPNSSMVVTLNSEARFGLKLWRQNSCGSCHQLYGLGGFMGPDLTNVTRRLPDPVLHHYLEKGGSRMPSFKLRKNERQAIIEFLKTMNQTGQGTLVHPKGSLPWYQFPFQGEDGKIHD